MALDWEFKLKAPWGDESIILGQSNPFDPDEIGSIIPVIHITSGIGLPTFLDVDVNFKDIIGTPAVEGFTNLTYQGYPVSGSIAIDDLGTDIFTQTNFYTPTDYANGISGTLRFDLTPGNFNGGYNVQTFRFNIYGISDATSELTIIEARHVSFQVQKDSSNITQVLPKSRKIQYTKYTNINPLSYKFFYNILHSKKIIISYEEFPLVETSNIIKGNNWANTNSPTYSFINNQNDFDLIISLEYLNSLPNGTVLPMQFHALSSTDGVNFGFECVFDLEIEIIENTDYSNLNFNAIKNFKEAIPQTVIVPDFTGTVLKLMPSWMTYDEINNTYLPWPTSLMEAGTHIGIIYFTDENENELFRINVTYIISDYISTDYENKDRAFTLDPKFLNLNTANTNSYYQVNTTVKVFEFYTNLETEYTLNEKYIPFKGKEKFNIGRTIHRLMSKFNELFQMDEQYFRSEITIEAIEKNLTTNAVIRTDISDTIYFIAGLSRNQSKIGILDFNPLANRVTVNSVAILNYIIPEGDFEIRVKKNGTITENIAISNHNIVESKLLTFENYQKGDIISYEVYDLAADETFGIVKQFKLYPSGQFSYTIIWQDEFLLQKVIECTGDLLLKTDFEAVTMKNYLDLAENLVVIDNSKDCKLSINSGWVLQSDVDTVESLMRSKRIWISSNADKDTSGISLSYTGKSMVNIDKQRELVDYTLEFTINKKYNEETYSF